MSGITGVTFEASETTRGRNVVLGEDRAAALEAKDARLATICKRKISRLKKKTRRAA